MLLWKKELPNNIRSSHCFIHHRTCDWIRRADKNFRHLPRRQVNKLKRDAIYKSFYKLMHEDDKKLTGNIFQHTNKV